MTDPSVQKTEPTASPRALTLTDFQQLIRKMYIEKDVARGIDGTFMWLIEEVGELASALRNGTHEEQSLEFADVLAWLATIANVAGVDLDRGGDAEVRLGLSRLRTIRLHVSRRGKTMMKIGRLRIADCRLQGEKREWQVRDLRFPIFHCWSSVCPFRRGFPRGRFRTGDQAAEDRRRAGWNRRSLQGGIVDAGGSDAVGRERNAYRRGVGDCARRRRRARLRLDAAEQAVPGLAGPDDARSAGHPLRPRRRRPAGRVPRRRRVWSPSRTFEAGVQADGEHFAEAIELQEARSFRVGDSSLDVAGRGASPTVSIRKPSRSSLSVTTSSGCRASGAPTKASMRSSFRPAGRKSTASWPPTMHGCRRSTNGCAWGAVGVVRRFAGRRNPGRGLAAGRVRPRPAREDRYTAPNRGDRDLLRRPLVDRPDGRTASRSCRSRGWPTSRASSKPTSAALPLVIRTARASAR